MKLRAIGISGALAAIVLGAGFAAPPASASAPKPKLDAHGEPKAQDADNPWGMNDLEWAHCRKPGNWADCVKVKSHSDTAMEATEKYYDRITWINGTGDAFRHCYWSARMTIGLSEAKSKLFTDMHEEGAEWNPPLEKEMDLRNNANGRWAGTQAKAYEGAIYLCKTATDGGHMWIIKDGKLVQGT